MLDSRLHRLSIEAQGQVTDERAARLSLALSELASVRRARVLEAVTVRPATAADYRALDRLARLDCANPLEAPILLAEVAGQPIAAISPADGRVVADPFTPTAEVVALLELRAQQLRRAEPTRRQRARMLRRFRRATAPASA